VIMLLPSPRAPASPTWGRALGGTRAVEPRSLELDSVMWVSQSRRTSLPRVRSASEASRSSSAATDAGSRLDDVEAFTGKIARKSGLDLTYHEREERPPFLSRPAWILSTRYRPGGNFSAWAGRTLRLRCVDWVRSHRGRARWQQEDGRAYERQRPKLAQLDGPIPMTIAWERLSDQLRALNKRGRRPGGGDERLGDEAAWFAPRRARAAGVSSLGLKGFR
jgi:hypothetical protein